MNEYAIIIKKRGYGVIVKDYVVADGIVNAIKAFTRTLAACFKPGRAVEPDRTRQQRLVYVRSGEDWA